MIQRSSRASPGGSSALRTRWTRRSEFVTVPSDSAHDAAAGQDDVGDLGGRGQEDVLDDDEVEAARAGRSVRWRSASDWSGFSPIDVERGQLAAVHRLEHARTGASRASAGCRSPRPSRTSRGARRSRRTGSPAADRAARPCRRRPGRCSGRAAGSGRCRTCPTWPVSSDEVDQREDVVDRVVVLGDAERPADHRLVGASRRRGPAPGSRRRARPSRARRTRACRSRPWPCTPRSRRSRGR